MITLLGEATADQLPQLVFLRELLAKDLKLSDKGAAALDYGFLRGLLAIGLYTEFDCRKERMWNWMVSQMRFATQSLTNLCNRQTERWDPSTNASAACWQGCGLPY